MASFQALIDRIDKHESFIGEKFDTLGDKVSAIDRTLAAHIAVEAKTTTDGEKFKPEVKKALWGNGKPTHQYCGKPATRWWACEEHAKVFFVPSRADFRVYA